MIDGLGCSPSTFAFDVITMFADTSVKSGGFEPNASRLKVFLGANEHYAAEQPFDAIKMFADAPVSRRLIFTGVPCS